MADTARVTVLLGTGAATGGGISRFYWNTTALNTTTAQAVVDRTRDFWAALTTGYDSALSWTVLGAVDKINIGTGEIISQTGVTSRSGAATGASTTMPLANQVLVRWNTGLFTAGRALTGHTFIPRPLVTTGSSTAPGGTTLAQANAAITALLVAVTDATFHVYSRKHTLTASVQNGTVVPKWAILRSRRD